MTAAPVPVPEPAPFAPATAMDLGHPLRYPLRVDDAWRATCACHWWWLVDTAEAEAAIK